MSSLALDALLERAKGTVLGPVTGVDFNDRCIEVEFTVEASSVEELHRRIGHALRVLADLDVEYYDSTTSRLDPEREPVPA